MDAVTVLTAAASMVAARHHCTMAPLDRWGFWPMLQACAACRPEGRGRMSTLAWETGQEGAKRRATGQEFWTRTSGQRQDFRLPGEPRVPTLNAHQTASACPFPGTGSGGWGQSNKALFPLQPERLPGKSKHLQF
jgi:hypothetical protein